MCETLPSLPKSVGKKLWDGRFGYEVTLAICTVGACGQTEQSIARLCSGILCGGVVASQTLLTAVWWISTVSGIADYCKYTVSAVWVNMVVVSMKGS